MKMAANQQDLDHYQKNIFIRLQEAVFENAKFTKRFHEQMVKDTDVDTCNSNASKLHIIREVFSTHIVLVFFTHKAHYKIDGELNLIAHDNLFAIVEEAKKVMEHKQLREWI